MLIRAFTACVLAALALTPMAGAQVIPPAPPKPEPTPAWEPPKPPPVTPEPPKPPPLPTIEAPNLVTRDAHGAMVMLTEPAEEVAVRMLGVPEGKQALFDAVKAERSVLFQRRLAEKGPAAIKLRAGMKLIMADPSYEQSMDYLAPARELMLTPNLPRMLELAGVYDSRYVEAADKAVKNYSSEIGKDLKPQIENETISVQMQRTTNINIRRMALEPMRELDVLLVAVTDRWAKIGEGVEWHPTDPSKFAQAAEALKTATTTQAKADAAASVLGLLNPDECKGLLERAAPPAPTNRVIPDAPPSPPKGRPGQPMQPIKLSPPSQVK